MCLAPSSSAKSYRSIKFNFIHNILSYRYDPTTKKWQALPDMATPRRNAAACVVHSLLYVMGGDDGIMNLSSIEFLDPSCKTWKVAEGWLTQGRSYAGVAIIDKPADLLPP